MYKKKTFFTKEEIEQRKKDGDIAFSKRKKELYDKFSKTFSHIILNNGRSLSSTIKTEIGNKVKYFTFGFSLNTVIGYWLIKEKDFEKALSYVEKHKLEMREISHILSF